MTSKNKRIFIFCGEHSGDIHGAKLVKALHSNINNLSISGVAGPQMRHENISPFLAMEEFCVMGFTDVLVALPRLLKHKRNIEKHLLETNPDALILIDYPEFNILLAKALRKKGYQGKIVQYISPTVWAWRPKRADAIAAHYNALLTIYPFEKKYFSHTNLDVRYVGNPVKAKVDNYHYCEHWKEKLQIPSSPLVGLFPGSRISEIRLNFPKQISVAERLLKDNPSLSFAVSCVDESLKHELDQALAKSTLTLGKEVFVVPREYSYELMRDCDYALAKSGTVTLELALHKKPTVVMYSISKTNKFIAKYLLRINLPFYCIVNILANREIYPEIIDATIPEDIIYTLCKDLFFNENKKRTCIEACIELNALLGDNVAETRAAETVKEML